MALPLQHHLAGHLNNSPIEYYIFLKARWPHQEMAKTWDNTETSKWTRSFITKSQILKTKLFCDSIVLKLSSACSKLWPLCFKKPCQSPILRKTIHLSTIKPQLTILSTTHIAQYSQRSPSDGFELMFYTDDTSQLQVLNTQTILSECNLLSRRRNCIGFSWPWPYTQMPLKQVHNILCLSPCDTCTWRHLPEILLYADEEAVIWTTTKTTTTTITWQTRQACKVRT